MRRCRPLDFEGGAVKVQWPPLEMESWQEQVFFDLARDDPLAIRTAHLTREINHQGEVEYYLAIAVDFPQPKPVETVNFLAVHHTPEGEVFALVAAPQKLGGTGVGTKTGFQCGYRRHPQGCG